MWVVVCGNSEINSRALCDMLMYARYFVGEARGAITSCKMFIEGTLVLTGLSLIVHVKLAAGREFREVQLPRTISPGLYFALNPFNCGRESGVSV